MSELRPPQIGTYKGYTIATADCCLPETKDLFGVRLWFDDENYYVIIGVSDVVRKALGGNHLVKCYDDRIWATHAISAAQAAGYHTPADNYTYTDERIYYIKGNREERIRAIGRFCEDMFYFLNHRKESYAAWIMRAQIRKALKLHDPTWQDSNGSENWEDAAAAAKKIVESGN